MPKSATSNYVARMHDIGLIDETQKLTMPPRSLSQDELKQARNSTRASFL